MELTQTPLFAGTQPQEAQAMLRCLGAYTRSYPRGDTIFHVGQTVDALGVVLSGSVTIESTDIWGARSILGRAAAGEIFAETYAAIPSEPLLVDVTAAEDAQVLFLQVAKLLHTCPASCAHHSRLIENLLQISARKNLSLSRRILHTTPKSIRGRVLSYLSEQAALGGSPSFTIPFDRQQLADYLGVDRSALSATLSKLRQEGILTCRKNSFTLHRPV